MLTFLSVVIIHMLQMMDIKLEKSRVFLLSTHTHTSQKCVNSWESKLIFSNEASLKEDSPPLSWLYTSWPPGLGREPCFYRFFDQDETLMWFSASLTVPVWLPQQLQNLITGWGRWFGQHFNSRRMRAVKIKRAGLLLHRQVDLRKNIYIKKIYLNEVLQGM